MKAWYFSKNDCKLRYGDGRKIKAGITHKVAGKPGLCNLGLHGSVRIIDALSYAPGNQVWAVNITGDLDKGSDKVCGNSRKYLWGFDATEVLREFARKQALINIKKIKPYCSAANYELILKFLKTGDESLRSAAESAAESAARSAARSAAWSVARSAARSAAWSAWSAAWSAAESAAESAAGSAAWSAVGSVAWSAAWSAARSAARSAAESAANKMLEEMLIKEAKRLGVYK